MDILRGVGCEHLLQRQALHLDFTQRESSSSVIERYFTPRGGEPGACDLVERERSALCTNRGLNHELVRAPLAQKLSIGGDGLDMDPAPALLVETHADGIDDGILRADIDIETLADV